MGAHRARPAARARRAAAAAASQTLVVVESEMAPTSRLTAARAPVEEMLRARVEEAAMQMQTRPEGGVRATESVADAGGAEVAAAAMVATELAAAAQMVAMVAAVPMPIAAAGVAVRAHATAKVADQGEQWPTVQRGDLQRKCRRQAQSVLLVRATSARVLDAPCGACFRAMRSVKCRAMREDSYELNREPSWQMRYAGG